MILSYANIDMLLLIYLYDIIIFTVKSVHDRGVHGPDQSGPTCPSPARLVIRTNFQTISSTWTGMSGSCPTLLPNVYAPLC